MIKCFPKPEVKECAGEKSTFDGLIEPSPTQAASHNDDEPPHSSGALAILQSLSGYHYGNFLRGQFSFPVPNKLLSQHALVNSHVSMLDDFEEEITFYCSDGNREEKDDDVLMEIKPCTPFGTQLFPHHDDISPQAPCEVVPASKEMMHHKQAHHDDFSGGEPSPVITREPTIRALTVDMFTAEEPVASETDAFQYPKRTTGFLSTLPHSNRYNWSVLLHKLLTKDALVTMCVNAFQILEDKGSLDALHPHGRVDLPLSEKSVLTGRDSVDFTYGVSGLSRNPAPFYQVFVQGMRKTPFGRT